jgi:hypothetical protein
MQEITWMLLINECCFMVRDLTSMMMAPVPSDGMESLSLGGLPTNTANLLFMVESVKICLILEDKVLVQGGKTASETSTPLALPIVQRMSGESPQSTARRFWTTVLRMPLQSARFIEDPDAGQSEVVEIHRYSDLPELRAVQRLRIVQIQLVKNNAVSSQVRELIGMPGHKAFHTADLSEATNRRDWIWADPEECDPKVRELARTESSRRPRVVTSWDGPIRISGKEEDREKDVRDTEISEFTAYLHQHGLETEHWTGKDGVGTVASLLDELTSGLCSFLLDGSGTLLHVSNVVLVRVWNPGGEFLLVETGTRAEGDEAVRWRMRLLGGRRRRNETVLVAGQRVLRDFLDLGEDDVEFQTERAWGYEESVEQTTEEYPGLKCRCNKHFVDVRLKDCIEVARRLRLAAAAARAAAVPRS